jgi:hypothetical protein
MVYEALRTAYLHGNGGYMWCFGFVVHGSVIIDLIFWSAMTIMILLLVIIE